MARDDGPLLTAEEMGFLHTLFQGEGDPEGATPSGRARLDLDPAGSGELAMYLRSLGPMSLSTERANHQLSFPAQVVEDDQTGLLAMELAYPGITERHPAHDRSLRVRPADHTQVLLMDPNGWLTAPEVVDLSVTGLSMLDSPSAGLRLGQTLPGLLLSLGAEPVTVDGVLVRNEPSGSDGKRRRLALTLTTSAEVGTALQAYVFRRYREVEQGGADDPFTPRG